MSTPIMLALELNSLIAGSNGGRESRQLREIQTHFSKIQTVDS
jgi:hypothetical protein